MRHFLAVRALAIGVAERAQTALLIAPAGGAQRGAPRLGSAVHAAVTVTAIAATAEEEDLATLGPTTGDEAQRVHVGFAALEKLDAVARPCDLRMSTSTSGDTTESSERLTPGSRLLRGRTGVRIAVPVMLANFQSWI